MQLQRLASGQNWLGIGTTTPRAGSLIDAVQNVAGASVMRLTNLNTVATGAQSGFEADNGTNYVQLAMTGQGFTPVGTVGPDTGYLSCSGSGGLLISSLGNAPLYFTTNSYVEKMRLTTGGHLLIGAVQPIVSAAYDPVDVTANFNGGMPIKITNQNAGTNAYAAFYMQNDTHDNCLFTFYSSGAASSGLVKPRGAALFADGPGGLTLGTNAATPLYFGVNATVIASIGPGAGNVGGWMNIDAQCPNFMSAQFKNSYSGTTGYFRIGVATGANSLITGDVQNDVDLYMPAVGGTAKMNFSLDNGGTLAFQLMQGGYMVARGGYQGGAGATNHWFYQSVAGNGCLGVVHNNSTPTGVQALYSQTPNIAGSPFFQGMDGYGTTYGGKFSAYSNGGIANYSANNVNFSDARAKHSIERHRDNAKLSGQLWSAFREVDWGRFKFEDQTHGDYNYGYTAQGVAKAFDGICDLTEDWWAGFDTTEMTKDVVREPRLGVYDHDLENIGRAVLAMAQARIEALEEKITKLERMKH
jgi:hypothetical protein